MVGAILAGCAVGPNYHRPQIPVDAHFANAGEPGFSAGDPVERYWTGFQDPLLTGLIEDALVHNKDLAVAAANLRQARAAKRLAGFDLYPTVTLAGSYTHNLDSQQELPGYQHAISVSSTPRRPDSMVYGSSICSAVSGAMSKRPAPTSAPALRRCAMRESASSPRWRATTSSCAACKIN